MFDYFAVIRHAMLPLFALYVYAYVITPNTEMMFR